MSKPVLMAIDDDPAVLQAVARDLRRKYGDKFQIVRADSGQAALEQLEQLKEKGQSLALFLVDQRMPGMTGTEFLEQAKTLSPKTKRVLLTAYWDQQVNRQGGVRASLDHYMLKPWDPPEERLYPVLDDLLEDWCTLNDSFDGECSSIKDPVDCAVFAPSAATVGSSFLVQVWVYRLEQEQEIRFAAMEVDDEAKRRGKTTLKTEIIRGSKLNFELKIPLLIIDEPIQEIVWQGRSNSVSFEVTVPENIIAQTVISKVTILQDSVPIGHIRFKLPIQQILKDLNLADCKAYQYKKVFISYASIDREEVLRRVQMLSVLEIQFFQDILNLKAGQKWETELYRHLDDSDAMFLFWSTSAKKSDWVAREWRYWLARKGDDSIYPVIIEGPPVISPPQELAHLHFNDKVLYFIQNRKIT